MTGIAHLSTGLYLKARFPRAPLLWLLLAAEASDLLWVLLNLLHAGGEAPLEATRVQQPFHTIASLQLLEQPFSHSLVSNVGLALGLAGLAYLGCVKTAPSWKQVALPVFLAVLGHFLLDFLVHDADQALGPWSGAARLGPALGLDPAAPTLGLSATRPLVSWALQTAVAAACGAYFVMVHPTTARRRWIFAGVLLLFCASPALMFVRDLAPGLFTSTPALVAGTLGEIVVLGTALYVVVTRVTHPVLRPSYGPYSDELANLLRGSKLAAAALAAALGAVYLLEAGLEGQRQPQVALCSAVLGVLYLGLGAALAGPSLSAWWPALLVPLLVGPGLRVAWGAGRLGLLVTTLELLLVVCAFTSLHRLRSHKLTL